MEADIYLYLFASAVYVTLATTLIGRYVFIRKELKERRESLSRLEEISEKGSEETIWEVESAGVLPERARGALSQTFRINEKYKLPEETSADYLERVLDTFELREKGDQVVAYRKGLYLLFTKKSLPETFAEKEVEIFEPWLTVASPITTHMRVAQHHSQLTFQSYSDKLDLKGWKASEWADVIDTSKVD